MLSTIYSIFGTNYPTNRVKRNKLYIVNKVDKGSNMKYITIIEF